MTKRDMMNAYYSDVELRTAELALKDGIGNKTIRLVGNEISGDTYRARQAIKTHFAARWNSVKKCWVITKDQVFAETIFANGLTL